jgi:hypothetical protein
MEISVPAESNGGSGHQRSIPKPAPTDLCLPLDMAPILTCALRSAGAAWPTDMA